MTAFLRPARWLFSSVGSLTQRTVRAGVWLVIGDGANRVSGFVRLVILARVLSPADFGLMGIALVVTKWVEEFSELGLKDALIQKTGDVRPYLDTVWTAQILRAFGIAVVLVAGAPLAGWFFAEPLAVHVIQVLAVESIVRGLSSPAMILLRKELEIRREVVWRVSSASAALLVSIPLAFLLRNVWALVLSLVAVSVVETCLSYLVAPYRPRLRLSWRQLRELRNFGRWVFWLRVTNFLSSTLDSIVVGKRLGAAALGTYQMGYQLAFVPTATVGLHAHGIMFPAFSKVERPEDLRAAVLRALGALSSVMLPLGVFFTVFRDQIVRLALGDRWLSVVPILVLLAWAGIIQTHSLLMSALLMAKARLNLDIWTGVVKVLVLAGLLYPGATYAGAVGAAAALALAAVVAVIYQVVVVTRVTHLPATDIVRGLRSGLLGSIPLSLSALVVSPGLSLFVCLVAVGALAASAAIIAAPLHSYITGRTRRGS